MVSPLELAGSDAEDFFCKGDLQIIVGILDVDSDGFFDSIDAVANGFRVDEELIGCLVVVDSVGAQFGQGFKKVGMVF